MTTDWANIQGENSGKASIPPNMSDTYLFTNTAFILG